MSRPALLSLFLAGALVSPALAMDPRMPLLSEDQGPAAKVERFRQAYAEDSKALAGLDAAAPARDRIHRALLAAVPAYAQAYAEYERLGDNADAWQAVASSSDDLYLKSHATYFLGRSLLAQDDLAGAAEALEAVRGRLRVGTPYTDEATFYLGYVYARLPELGEHDAQGAKARAQQLLGELVSRDVPERVSEGAHWLLRELRGEGMGPLLELAKRMETIERLIRRTRTGKGTQKRQEQVVAQIDKLIELMREKECKGGSCSKPGEQHKPGECKKPGAPKGTPKTPPKSGAKKSTLPGGDGKEGELHEASRAADQDGWASMKKKEREKVEQFLKQRFPTRYRELIEKYFRGVAEADK